MTKVESGAHRLARRLLAHTGRVAILLLVPAVIAVLSACGQAPNRAPTIGPIPAQYTATDKELTARLTFTDDRPATVAFTFTSDDETLLPAAGIAAVGDTTDRVITIQPAPGMTGSTNVNATVTDAEGLSATTTFPVRVVAPFTHQHDTMHAPAPATGARFGAAVAVSHGPGVPPLVMIAAPESDSATHTNAGVVHVYAPAGNQSVEVATLAAPDGYTGARFGSSMAASPHYLVVADIANNQLGHYAGAVYVYQRDGDTWTDPVKLVASDGTPTAAFGYSVAVDGDHVVVGAHFDVELGAAAGAAYVYKRSGDDWVEVAKLTASDAAAGDQFGESVAVAGDLILVGAPYQDAAATNAGAVYVYSRASGSWLEVDTLTASDAEADEWFGIAVAMTADHAVIGAQGESDIGPNGGAAYVLDRSGDTYTEVDKLVASDSAGVDQFGAAVAIHDTTLVVGAYREDDQAPNAGAVYVYELQLGAWTEVTKLYANDGAAEDLLGAAIALGPGHVVMGAEWSDAAALDAGAAYVMVW